MGILVDDSESYVADLQGYPVDGSEYDYIPKAVLAAWSWVIRRHTRRQLDNRDTCRNESVAMEDRPRRFGVSDVWAGVHSLTYFSYTAASDVVK